MKTQATLSIPRTCALALALMMSMPACASSEDSSDSTTTTASGTSPVPSGTLRVRVTGGSATAAAKAPLIVGLYQSCPPVGPPYDLVFSRVDAPVFPAVVELTSVRPGTYHVFAYVGAGKQPAPADPQVCSPGDATLTTSAGAELEVALP